MSISGTTELLTLRLAPGINAPPAETRADDVGETPTARTRVIQGSNAVKTGAGGAASVRSGRSAAMAALTPIMALPATITNGSAATAARNVIFINTPIETYCS